jgi:PAS domain S-box-containing protein
MTKKAKILVVEHDSVELASTARVLRSARFDVMEASSGAECLRTAKEHRPDLLLLSMELPDLHADQVCRDLKAEPTLKATVVLLISAQGQSSEDRADALEMGADGCIVRPLGERELVAWVRSLVGTHQANTALRHTAETYRTVAEFASDWLYWITQDGTLRYIAPTCERITGYKPREFQRSPSLLSEIVVSEDRPSWDRHRRESHEEKKPGQLQFRIRRRDGQIVWLEHVCRPVLGAQGDFLGIRVNNRDITEREQAESERKIAVQLLSKSSVAKDLHELLRGITSVLQRWSGVAAVGLRLSDHDDYPYYETHGFDSEFVLAENRLCAMDTQGRPLRDANGIPILECMCGDILRGRFDPSLPFFTERGSYWTNSTSELLASTTEAERQTRTRNRCHAEGYESVALIPLRASGKTLGLLQFNDQRKGLFSAARIELFEQLADNIASALAQHKAVQDLRRSEDNLRREQQMLSEAQRIAHLGSWGWNILANELSWSDEVYRIFGLKPQECGATYDTFLASVHADDRESVEEAINRALTDSVAGYSMEHRVVQPDGSHRIVHGRGDVTFDSTGRPVRMIGTLHDITEQKVAELGLRDALAEVERLRDQLLAENVYLQEEIRLAHGFDEIVGRSEPLRGTLTRIEHVAGTDASVLLLGETGTGKELFARAIHDRSPRKDHPLVKVNCAALPSSLIESELFGHVKGAFTGALSDKVGRFELADGGTLFLDEIGELDPELQTKLLRVLQEGEFEKIGSTETRRVDIRVIAATNRDIQLSMEAGAFRQDLYYRLAVFPIKIPPLRQRREDIPLLVWHFITKKRARLGKTIDTVPKNVFDTLVQYEWPGNVRELENVIERSMIFSSGPTLLLSESFAKPSESRRGGVPSSSLDEMDRTHIVGVLEDCGWRVKGANNAADRLGLKPSTLRYRMSKLGIERPPRRPR